MSKNYLENRNNTQEKKRRKLNRKVRRDVNLYTINFLLIANKDIQ